MRRGCVSVGALRVDEAIEREVLRIVAPGAIEAAMDAVDHADAQTDATRRALELERRQARYEADRAQRQYDAVEPENRLVGETLERRWNAALARVAELEQRLATLAPTVRPVPVDRAQLLTLADDFPEVWRSPTTDIPLKKRIVRLLIEEIVATATAEPPQVTLVMHWKGGKHTQLMVRKNRAGGHRYCTDRAVIDVVRDLARSLPDAEIARIISRRRSTYHYLTLTTDAAGRLRVWRERPRPGFDEVGRGDRVRVRFATWNDEARTVETLSGRSHPWRWSEDSEDRLFGLCL